MDAQVITSIGSMAVSGGLAYGAGWGLGWAIRLVLKILLAVAGGLMMVSIYLQNQGFLSINWLKIDESINALFNSQVISGNIQNSDWLTVITNNIGVHETSAVFVAFPVGLLKGLRG